MEFEQKLLQITLNGERRTVAKGLTVEQLLLDLQIAVLGVAVERNRLVVRRAEHAACLLQDGDVVEIVQFVGGGQ